MMYVSVALGGVLGSLLRWLIALALPADDGWPWGTLLANATGCLVIGFYSTLTGPDGRLFVGPRVRQFVLTGFCGGYTTFSAFSLEIFTLWTAGDAGRALIYLASSLASWLAAVWLGDLLAQRLNSL